MHTYVKRPLCFSAAFAARLYVHTRSRASYDSRKEEEEEEEDERIGDASAAGSN